MPAASTPVLPADYAATLRTLLPDTTLPASDALLIALAESVRNRSDHAHPRHEDLFCANLTAWSGERTGPLLARLLAECDRTERRRTRLVALQNDEMDIRGALAPDGRPRRVPMELGETLLPAVEWLLDQAQQLTTVLGTLHAVRDLALRHGDLPEQIHQELADLLADLPA